MTYAQSENKDRASGQKLYEKEDSVRVAISSAPT